MYICGHAFWGWPGVYGGGGRECIETVANAGFLKGVADWTEGDERWHSDHALPKAMLVATAPWFERGRLSPPPPPLIRHCMEIMLCTIGLGLEAGSCMNSINLPYEFDYTIVDCNVLFRSFDSWLKKRNLNTSRKSWRRSVCQSWRRFTRALAEFREDFRAPTDTDKARVRVDPKDQL